MGMTAAEKCLKRLDKSRPRVLDDKARAYAKSLTKDKEKAFAFLLNGGFINKDGSLAREYQILPEDLV